MNHLYYSQSDGLLFWIRNLYCSTSISKQKFDLQEITGREDFATMTDPSHGIQVFCIEKDDSVKFPLGLLVSSYPYSEKEIPSSAIVISAPMMDFLS